MLLTELDENVFANNGQLDRMYGLVCGWKASLTLWSLQSPRPQSTGSARQ
jgi:hypothetical protein